MLSLTSRSFASGPEPVLLPHYTGAWFYSAARIRQGQHCASPQKAHGHQSWDPTPALDMHTPALEKKKWKQHFCPRVFVGFHFFLIRCRLWGPCCSHHFSVIPTSGAVVLHPTSPSPPTATMQHCCLGHCGDLLSSQSQDCIAGAAHALQLNSFTIVLEIITIKSSWCFAFCLPVLFCFLSKNQNC